MRSAIPEPLHGDGARRGRQAGQDRRRRRVAARWRARGIGVRCRRAQAASRVAERRPTLLERFDGGSMRPGPAAFENLRQIMRLVARHARAEPGFTFDLSLARGLSYYTGAIMEVERRRPGRQPRRRRPVRQPRRHVPRGRTFRPAASRWASSASSSSWPSAACFRPSLAADAGRRDGGGLRRVRRCRRRCAWPARLREQGLRVLVYPDADKIGKQIKYADCARDSVRRHAGRRRDRGDGTVTVKNLAAQTQDTLRQAAAGAAILEALRQRG